MTDRERVIHIERGSDADRILIGGKACSLVSLLEVGAPVPPAFVLTTHAYRDWADRPDLCKVRQWVEQGIARLEVSTGRRFGEAVDGLIVSVRSGAPASMPGMMDTLLNVGIGSLSSASERFLIDARARFLWQFAELVLGLDSAWVRRTQREFDSPLEYVRLIALEELLRVQAESARVRWPSSPMDELVLCTAAVFGSWQSARARLYRRMQKISESPGTAATIQQMVFGNRDTESGSGVAFTRNPTTGARELTGEFLVGGQGEEVVSGRHTASSLLMWRDRQPALYGQLEALGRVLEATTNKVQDIEFTVESGRMYILQCRPARLTARSAARIAVEMHDEGRLTKEQAIHYARQHGFGTEKRPDERGVRPDALAIVTGLPVGGGVVAGRVAFSAQKVSEIAAMEDPVVFVANETSPTLLPLMQRSVALVTMHGGITSHAAVVARELGKPCIVGVGVGARVEGNSILLDSMIDEGAWITVDGDSGLIYADDVTVLRAGCSDEDHRLRTWVNV